MKRTKQRPLLGWLAAALAAGLWAGHACGQDVLPHNPTGETAFSIPKGEVAWKPDGVVRATPMNGRGGGLHEVTAGNPDITWQYDVTSDGVVITGAVPAKGGLVIPEELEGRPVTGIGEDAFYGCSGLTGVEIPASVTNIGGYAFAACSGLETFSVASNNPAYTVATGLLLTKDGKTLVCGVNGDVVIPASVKCIGEDAFYGLGGLTSVTIPASVTSIGDCAFSDCSGLEAFSVASNNPAYTAAAGLLLTKDGKTLLWGVNGEVAIPDSVTFIEAIAFCGYSGLTGVAIPDGVTCIGYGAFARCNGLTNAWLGNGVTSIEGYAFWECGGLTDVEIPASVTSIEEMAFAGCTGLTGVEIPDGVKSIGTNAFGQCTGLTRMTIRGNITNDWSNTSDGPFCNCTNLSQLVLGEKMTKIGRFMFFGCTGLANVEIPASVTSIEEGAFAGCTGLAGVAIPASVTNIGVGAFAGCIGLPGVEMPAGMARIEEGAFAGCTGLTGVDIPAGVTSIEAMAFAGCTGLTEVDIPDGVKSIGTNAFGHCTGLTHITILGNITNDWYTGPFAGCTNVSTLVFGERVTRIGKRMFYGCSGLQSVTISCSVTEIGNYAFQACSALTVLTIPSSVTNRVGIGAFSGTGLQTLCVPASWEGTDMLANAGVPEGCEVVYGGVPTAGEVTWRYSVSNGLATVTGAEPAEGDLVIPSELGGCPVTSIGENAFSGLGGLTSVTIPDSVTSIENYAFIYCRGLTNVTLGTGVTNIDIGTFYNCSRLEAFSVADGNPVYKSVSGLLLTKDGGTLIGGVNGDVVIPGSVTSIWLYAFSYCTNLTHVTIPASVTGIGEGAFENCSGLASVTLPDGVTCIEYSAFSGCSGLTNAVMGKGVTNIEANAFYGCSGLRSVTIPDGVRIIGDNAFAYCSGLTSVELPDSVTSVEGEAFFGCSSLTYLTIPDSVTSIGYNAFGNCSGLKTVYAPASWEGTRYLVTAGVPEGCNVVYVEAPPAGEVAWRYSVDNGVATVTGAEPAEGTLAIPEQLDGWWVTGIGTGAFSGCTNLAGMVLPDSVARIGSEAFLGCFNLTSLAIPGGVESVGRDAFWGASASLFDDAAIPGVRLVDGWAVESTAVLGGELELVGVRGIADGTFADCTQLTSVTVGRGVEWIGVSAFSGCSGLRTAELAESVRGVGAGAFLGCTGLERLTVPESWRGTDMLAEADVPASCEIVYQGAVAQTLSWAALGAGWVPGDRVAMQASASSGRKVVFDVLSGPAVVEGDVLTFSAAGTVTVRARQVGSASWAAVEETRTVEVSAVRDGRRAYADLAPNYSGEWSDGSNGGEGFGAWRIVTRGGSGSGWAGYGLWNPSVNGFEGTWAGKSKAFGMVGKGEGWSVEASRNFIRPLGAGDSFSLEMAVNWDSNLEGATKGFALTAGGEDIIVVNHGAFPGKISVNGDDGHGLLNAFGLHPMTWTFTVQDGTTMEFTATCRDNPEQICSGTLLLPTSAIDGFRLQSADQYEEESLGIGDFRQSYYDNFRLFLVEEQGRGLSLELESAGVLEGAGSVRCVVRRTGATGSALAVNVSCSRPGDVRVPGTVTIPAGARMASFTATVVDNAVLDGERMAVLSVSAEGYSGAHAELAVLDDEIPGLSLSAESGSVREGGTLRVQVSREGSTETALEVQLSGLATGRVQGPSRVVINSGERSAVFEVTVPDNDTAQAEAEVTLRAAAAGYGAASLEFLVLDDDVPGVRLEVRPESVGEGAGVNAVRATLSRTDTEKGMDKAIRVRLATSPSGQLVVPDEVVVPAGKTGVAFGITPVDNGNVDGKREVAIEGLVMIASCGCGGQPSSGEAIRAVVTVLDNDVPALSLRAEPTTMKEGLEEAGWLVVGHNSVLDRAVTVALGVDTAGEISVPARVTIPSGAAETRVPVKTLDDGVEDGAKLVSVYAEEPSGAFAGASTWLQVSDQNLPDLEVAWVEAAPVAVGKAPFAVRFAATNTGFAACTRAIPYAVHVLRSQAALPGSNTVAATGSLAVGGGLAAGGTLEAEVEVTAPELPGDAWVAVVLDPDGAVPELDNANNTGRSGAVGVAAAWTATVAANAETYLPGETITLSGTATLAGGGAAAGVDVDVYLLMDGMRRTLKARTGTDGAFSTSWVPSAGEAGHYQAGACYPDAASAAVQDEFDVLGMKRADTGNVVWDMALGDAETRTVTLRNPAGVALTELAAEFTGVPAGCGLQWELPGTLAAGGSATLKITATATGLTEGVEYEKFAVRVMSAEGAELEFPLWFHSQAQKAYLRASPASIDTTMAVGRERYIEVTVLNDGKGDSGAVTASVPDVPWLKIAGGGSVDNLASGESMTVTLLFCPEEAHGLEPTRPLSGGSLTLNCANGNGCRVPLKFTPVSEATGGLRVTATDDNTYHLESAPNLSGAAVRVGNRYTGETVAEGTTGADGTWTVEGLPEGTYRVTVSAANHGTSEQDATVEPGRTASVFAFLQYRLVTATWEVVRTEIEDAYEVQLVLDFETSVPAPLVKTTMPKELPVLGPDDPPYAFNIVLENTGVIAAERVTVAMPEIEGYAFRLSENGIPLPAKSSKTLGAVFYRTGATPAEREKGTRETQLVTVRKCRYTPETIVVYPCGENHPEYSYKSIIYHGECWTEEIPVETKPASGGGGDPVRWAPGGGSGGTGSFQGPGVTQPKFDCDAKRKALRRAVQNCKAALQDIIADAEAVLNREVMDGAECMGNAYVLALPEREPSAEERRLGDLMRHVYNSPDDANWKKYPIDLAADGYEALVEGVQEIAGPGFTVHADGLITQDNGFKARIYKPTVAGGRYVIAFAGTEWSAMSEIFNDFLRADIGNALCLTTDQYEAGRLLLQRVLAGLPDEKFHAVGHSLGGGIVQYAMLGTRLEGRVEGLTYNPAGLCRNAAPSVESCDDAAAHIVNYRAMTDPISTYGLHAGPIYNVEDATGHSSVYIGVKHPSLTAVDLVGDVSSAIWTVLVSGVNLTRILLADALPLDKYYNRATHSLNALRKREMCLSELWAASGDGLEIPWDEILSAAETGNLANLAGEYASDKIKEKVFTLLIPEFTKLVALSRVGEYFFGEDWKWAMREMFGIKEARAVRAVAGGDPMDAWAEVSIGELNDFLSAALELDGELSAERLRKFAPVGIGDSALEAFAARMNATAKSLRGELGPEDAVPVDFPFIERMAQALRGVDAYMKRSSYATAGAAWEDALRYLEDYANEGMDNVCASVSIRLSQTVAMTREAFDGTLTMYNGHGTEAIRDLKLEVSVLDEEGVECRDLFQPISIGTAGAMDGKDVLEGGMTVAAGGTGLATVRFIPERGAAPAEEKLYRFGGTVTYTDPFSGERAVIELVPVALTVSPSPYLHLDYFVQRDVYADDPFTDVVEASLPAELAVLVRNAGGGEARNVTIASVQPEKVLDEKGAAIDFRLSNYSQDRMALNGATAHLGLNSVGLGSIPAGEARVAQWWLTSSIQGHFTGMKATVAPMNSWNTPDTMLVDTNTAVHKLIRSVVADADGLPDFLTSEEGNLYGLADTIWLSASGEALDVAPAGSVSVSGSLGGGETSLGVTVEATVRGWTYGWTAVPGAERYEIVRVVRSDGSEVPLRNAWITDRVFRDGADPQWETRLHIVDEGAAGNRSYTVTLAAKAGSGPAVVSFEGVADGSVVAVPPNALTVVFSAAVDGATFGTDDLTLRHQGTLVDVSGLSVSGSGTRWTVSGLGSACAADGRYELVVQAAGIAGTDGVLGCAGRSVSWTVCGDTTGPVVLGVVRETGLQGEVFRVALSEAAEGGSVLSGTVAVMLWGDLPVALPDGMCWEADGSGGLVLKGLEHALAEEGEYTLTVSGNGLRDAAGNAGSGRASVSWTVDTVPPEPPGQLWIEPDLGESDRDGITSEAAVTVFGVAQPDVVQVTLFARAASGEEVFLGGPVEPKELVGGTEDDPVVYLGGLDFECPVVLPWTGSLTLVVRCEDAVGNASDTPMEIFLDTVPAVVSWDAVEAGTAPVDRAVLRFDPAVAAGDVTAARLRLERDGRQVPLKDSVTVSPLAGEAPGTAFEVTGLAARCARAGRYALRFDAGGVRKASSGLASLAGAVAVVEWDQIPQEVLVTGLSARQRYPWNGLVDIDYEVGGAGMDGAETWVEVAARDAATGNAMPLWSLEGDGADGPVEAGTHRMTWNMAADRGGEFASDALSVTMAARRGDAAYLVVDMSGGREATHWPVSGLPGVPAGGWTDEYKTTKLVLRRVEAGTFAMGSPEDEPGRAADEVRHSVTLTRAYWMGVFEVTQKQWELVMGTRPAGCPGDTRPVEGVSYRDIRGRTAGVGWPADGRVDAESFLGVLREKTRLAFDLPTEAQWERACRAGTDGALNSGKALSGTVTCPNLGEIAKYTGNGAKHGADDGLGGAESAHAAAGSYRPNAWGLYDMHGNVAEWCLDWVGDYPGGMSTDPLGKASGVRRAVRGGSWDDSAMDCRSAARGESAPGNATDSIGFRMCWVGADVPDSREEQDIEWAEGIATQAVIGGRMVLDATATGGGAVDFKVISGPARLSGNVLTFTGTGTVVLRAVQAGDSTWAAAERELSISVKEVTGLAISGASSVDAGESAVYSCTAAYSDGTSNTVTPTWSLVSGDACGSITTGGIFTAKATSGECNVTIRASYGGKTATKTVAVKPVLTDLSIDGALKVPPGTSAMYTCTACYSDGMAREVMPTWSLVEGDGFGSITADGVFTASATSVVGRVTIQASYDGKTATKTVMVQSVVTGQTDFIVPAGGLAALSQPYQNVASEDGRYRFGETGIAQGLPTGSAVFFWNGELQKWGGGIKTAFGWDPAESNHVLQPGEGFWVRNGGREAVTVTAAGEKPSEASLARAYAGGWAWNAMAYPYPEAIRFGDTELAGQLGTGAMVLFWDSSSELWMAAYKTVRGWNSGAASRIIGEGEAFFVRSATDDADGTWVEEKPYEWP